MHTLENDQLCVTISDHGAELSGIFDKKNDREILWNADPSHGNAMLRFFFRM